MNTTAAAQISYYYVTINGNQYGSFWPAAQRRAAQAYVNRNNAAARRYGSDDTYRLHAAKS